MMRKLNSRFLFTLFLLKLLHMGIALGAPVVIKPGASIQSAVNHNPEGTTFTLKAGIYRQQTVVPKNGNTFIGEPGAIISGARHLTSFTREGRYWVATGQTQQGQATGQCIKNPDGTRYEGCWYPEDLFIDDVPLWHVTTLSEVGPGRWYFDYDADKIYFADNPAGHKVETSVTRHAFLGGAANVTIRGLIIEKYAVPAQFGAIHGYDHSSRALSTHWIIDNCEIRLNHGAGIRTGNKMQILKNRIHDNGQIGIVGEGDDILVDGNELAYNNYAGFSQGWEAGGSKWVKTHNLVVRGNYSHHNKGPGLWTDIYNIHTLYENNTVIENEGVGIFHEISYDAVIRKNTVKGNGKAFDPWLYGAQILISSSRNAEVYNNTVEVAATAGNGIAIIQQDRGTGRYGPCITIGNYIHHNVVTYLGNHGQSGAAADYNPDVMFNGNNRFDFNTYHAPHLDRSRWVWGGNKDWVGFRAAGQEAHGAADTNAQPTKTIPRLGRDSPRRRTTGAAEGL
jgi:parallel beta-helix repeat protein